MNDTTTRCGMVIPALRAPRNLFDGGPPRWTSPATGEARASGLRHRRCGEARLCVVAPFGGTLQALAHVRRRPTRLASQERRGSDPGNEPATPLDREER